MKIVVFSRSTTHHFISGGMETHLKTLCEGLVEAGHSVTVITTAKSQDQNENILELINGVKYYFIGNTTPGQYPLNTWEKLFYKLGLLKVEKLGSKNYFEESLKNLKDLHTNDKLDLIISQSTAAYGVYQSVDIPIYSIIHGTINAEIKNRLRSATGIKSLARFLLLDFPRLKWESVFKNKQFFEKCRGIISVSDDLKNSFLGDYPSLFGKTAVINNGVDTEVFKPGKEKYPLFTILYVGRMQVEKGIDLIIDAISILKNGGIPVYAKLIGTGSDIERFKPQAQRYGLLDNEVAFLGGVENSKLSEYYQHCHVFVLPTRREEGHPVTVSEAFCSGLPVVCTEKGGLKDLIQDGINGLFVSYSASDLADKIKLLYVDREMLAKLSLNATEKGFKKFSKNAMISKYIEVLQI